MSKRKNFLIISMLIICLASNFIPVYALSENKSKELIEYVNIFTDSKDVGNEMKNDEKLMESAVIGETLKDKVLAKGTNSVTILSDTPYNIGVVYDYIGFNTSYILVKKYVGMRKQR